MNRYHQQITRVWKDKLTSQEKKAFLEDFLLNEREWKAVLEDEYRQSLEEDLRPLPSARSEIVLQRLHAIIGEQDVPGTIQAPVPVNKVMRMPLVLKWVAAAAVLIAVVTLFYQHNQRKQPTVVAGTETGPQAKLILQTNYTASNRQLQLEDGSVITLAPGSAIRYYQPFTNNKRDISLQGQAWFKVAKDTARPFTVYANNITTTALGTEFMVNTKLSDKVEIRLFEGKIVIRSVDSAFAMKDVFLSPGQMFNLDKQLGQYTVQLFEKNYNVANAITDKPATSSNIQPITTLEFEQQPIQEVLTEIGKRYHVKFVYDTAAVTDIQVTGKFLPSDSLQTVLSMLGTVNGLTFTVRKNIIAVSKIK
ncbi:MAG: FecR family protein [Chitinophagaceae bacterium]